MTFWTLIRRGLRYHARSHAGTFLGVVIGSAILIGALAVGDSVRGSLKDIALSRLGQTEFALASEDRFFRSALADDLTGAGLKSTALLQIPGTATSDDGDLRANQVQVLGIDVSFWNFSPERDFAELGDDELLINRSLAEHLHTKIGDTILLRVHQPSLLSRDAPISPQQDTSTAFRLSVKEIVPDDSLGNFSLRANQIPPFNAFVSRRFLQSKVSLEGKANVLLAQRGSNTPMANESATNTAPLDVLLKANFQLADAELQLQVATNQNVPELRSPRVFLDDSVVDAAAAVHPGAMLISTYFVNELRIGTNATPYSMVAGVGPPFAPADMASNEIRISQWLADDLQAKGGDQLSLTYFMMGADQRLEERTNMFRVRDVVPLEGIYADRALMPEFPGVAKAEKTDEWDAGFTIDMKKIRPKDEQYWEEYRGTPKAFITLPAAEMMWSNRFGAITAVRFPDAESDVIEQRLRERLEPSWFGLAFEPVRAQALAASSQSQDFGQLFLGFSFFLIVAALILVGLLFQFSLEQRTTEMGALLALGFRPSSVRRMFLGEGAVLALLGAVVGAAGGVLYARAMLLALTTLWRDAVGTTALSFHVQTTTLITGIVASVLISVLTLWLALRRQARKPAHELLAQGADVESAYGARKPRWAPWIACVSAIVAGGLVGWGVSAQGNVNPGIFFGAGSLLLLAGLAAASWVLTRIGSSRAGPDNAANLSLTNLGMRGCARRRKRSLATVGLLACGSFMVVAVAANKLDANVRAHEKSSGTGGFTLLGESTLPVMQNLNTREGRNFFGLDAKDLPGVTFVPFRVREGDDASCLNLNRAQTPRLLGVNPASLADRFTFTKVETDAPGKTGWGTLQRSSSSPIEEIPAIGDAASIQWALGKKVGDVLAFVDERGQRFNVRIVGAIANSILQGSLIIDEAEFVKRFPSVSGYRMFLIDGPSDSADGAPANVSGTLSRAMRDVGMELTPAAKRLAAFNAVQNTYLNTFQILGGLGLLLGSAGMGVVVLRNVLERRGELSVLQAIGFKRGSVRWLVLSEHLALLWFGLGLGMLAALAAVLPALLSPQGDLPWQSLGLTLLAVLVSGVVWTLLATRLALRGNLMESLRNN